MPKINYIRALIDSIDDAKLKLFVEEYAKKNKNFEAFLLEKSGKAVDTGKSYDDYREELSKILKKCRTRRGYVKVTRLKNAGMDSFYKLMNSHFNNGNFLTALWISLALMEMMQEAVLMNTKYKWGNRPYKSFEKILLECRDKFDSAYKFVKPNRKDRKNIFQTLVRCWWRENERKGEHSYFEIEDLFRYVERDEDLLAIQIAIGDIKPRASELDKKNKKKIGSWKKVWSGYFPNMDHPNTPVSLSDKLEQIEKRVKKELEKWD